VKSFIPIIFLIYFFLMASVDASADGNANFILAHSTSDHSAEKISENAMQTPQQEISSSGLDTATVSQPRSKTNQRSDEIRALQRMLIAEGYYEGPVNGIITPETRRAARDFLRTRE